MLRVFPDRRYHSLHSIPASSCYHIMVVMQAAGMDTVVLPPAHLCRCGLSSAASDVREQEAASVRLVPASAVVWYRRCCPGTNTLREMGPEGRLLAGGEVCPAVAHGANGSCAGRSPAVSVAVCCPSLHALGTELAQTWPFSAWSPAEQRTGDIKGFL